MSLSVRRAVPADADAVLELLRRLAEHQGELAHVGVDRARWAELLGRTDVVVLLAERDGVPLGYVSALRRPHFWSGGDVLALDDLFVSAAARGDGVGERLMLELARFALPDRLPVRWEVSAGNEAALRFYARLGAEITPKHLVRWLPEVYERRVTAR